MCHSPPPSFLEQGEEGESGKREKNSVTLYLYVRALWPFSRLLLCCGCISLYLSFTCILSFSAPGTGDGVLPGINICCFTPSLLFLYCTSRTGLYV